VVALDRGFGRVIVRGRQLEAIVAGAVIRIVLP
jgi:hypothetical protein